jgi:hypothetical protein
MSRASSMKPICSEPRRRRITLATDEYRLFAREHLFPPAPRSIVLSMTILWNMATLLLSRYWLSRRSSSFEN